MRTVIRTEGRQLLRDRWKGAGHVGWLTAAFLASLWACELSHAGFVGRERVATGLAAPMFVTHPPGDRSRLFIAERSSPLNNTNATANIRILNLETGMLEATPFLSISGINNNGEGGLLGMAFHPNYAANGKFYVYITANDSIAGTPFSSYIREYTVSANANVANTTFTPVLNFSQPQSNHTGGWIGFSPNDDLLYIMAGDGGNGNDQGTGHTEPGGNAQDLTANFLGKVLRIDVDSDGFPGDAAKNYANPSSNPFVGLTGDDEIWAYGLRNPFRAGFDRATGDLWIGDVGQERREEVDFQPGNSAGGENYGWRLREGFIATPTPTSSPVGGPAPGATDPIWDYKQGDAPDVLPQDANFLGNTVIGGVPYRGPDPTLQGVYFFADNGSNRIWTLRRPEGGGSPIVEYVTPMLPTDTGSPSSPSAISEDAFGNIYISYLTGSVYRIVTDTLTPGDFDADADVDEDDLALILAGYGMTTGADPEDGDADGDGDVDGADLLSWQQNLGWSALDVDPSSTGVPEPASAAVMGFCAVVVFGTRRACRMLRS
jgi:glucose/arabinose dehydrogenase